MKWLILCFLPFFVEGQNLSSTSRVGTEIITIGSDSVFPAKRLDTSFALFLVSDTSINRYQSIEIGEYANMFNDSCYLVKGYIVKDQSWECCNPLNYGYTMAKWYWVTKSYYYLDYEKRRLKDDIVVWISKER